MLGKYIQGFLVVKIRLFIIIGFKVPNRQVKSCLEIRELLETLLRPINCRLAICFALNDCNVVHGLYIFWKVL